MDERFGAMMAVTRDLIQTAIMAWVAYLLLGRLLDKLPSPLWGG